MKCKLRNRILPFILAISMMIGIMPSVAYAEPAQPSITLVETEYGYMLFANGNPIIIAAGASDKTKIYLDNNANGQVDDGEVPIRLDGLVGDITDGYDLKQVGIFGGANNTSVENTQITMTGGDVFYINGGGSGTTVINDACVTVRGGFTRWIYGGGQYSDVNGDTNVNISGDSTTVGYLFGGGEGGNVLGDANVTVSGGQFSAGGYDNLVVIAGGCNHGNVNGDVNLKVSNVNIKGSIYGGGNDCNVTGNIEVTISDVISPDSVQVFGSSFGGTNQNVKITCLGSNDIHSVIGVYNAYITGNAVVQIGVDTIYQSKELGGMIEGVDSHFEYEVAFYDAKDGSKYAPDSEQKFQWVKEGDAAAAPAYPEKEGKVFTGWKKVSDDSLYDFSEPVTEPVKLYATWEDKEETETLYFNSTDGKLHIGSVEGTVAESGSPRLGNGTYNWDANSSTLSLNGVQWITSAETAFHLGQTAVTLSLKDDLNTFQVTGEHAYADGNSHRSYGIYSEGAITVNKPDEEGGELEAYSGNYTFKAPTSGQSVGIYAKGGYIQNGGQVTAIGGDINGGGNSKGIETGEPDAPTNLTINKGSLFVKSGKATSVYGALTWGDLTLKDGYICALSEDMNASFGYGIWVKNTFAIEAGNVEGKGKTQGVYNKSLELPSSYKYQVNTATEVPEGDYIKSATAPLDKSKLENYKYIGIMANDIILTPISVTRDSLTKATIQFRSTKAGRYFYSVEPMVGGASDQFAGSEEYLIGTGGGEKNVPCVSGTNTITLNNLEDGEAKRVFIIAKKFEKSSSDNISKSIKMIIPEYNSHVGSVSGTVTNNNTPTDKIQWVAITLKNGNDIVAETTTDVNGHYSFDNIGYGEYSLIAKKGEKTVTKTITISETIANGDLVLPYGEKNAIVETKPDTPPVTAQGLNDLFESTPVADATKGITQQDLEAIAAGGRVEIRLTTEKKEESAVALDAAKLKVVAGDGKELFLLDMKVSKTVNDEAPVILTELNDLIEIVIKVPEALKGKSGISIMRVHNGAAENISQTATEGERFFINGEDIHILVKKFSTYAIAYNKDGSGSGGGSTTGGESGSGIGSLTGNESGSSGSSGTTGSPETGEVNEEEDNNQAGSGLYHLCLIAKGYKMSQKLTFTKVNGADGYIIYGAKCGIKNKLKRITDVKANESSYIHKKLKKETYYKYQIKAYKIIDGKKVILATSKVVHSTTTSKKYTNTTKVIVDVKSIMLTSGKSKKILGMDVFDKGKKVDYHTSAIRYESTNKKIATVRADGTIKAKTKGSCYVYVYAQNGIYQRVKVTVQ